MTAEDLLKEVIQECIKQVNEKYPDDMKLKDAFTDGFLSSAKWMQLFMTQQAKVVKMN